MISTAAILPTGNEIKEGIVLDTDSPEIMARLLKMNPQMEIRRMTPLVDVAETIEVAIKDLAGKVDLIVLVGGSGGGHRYSDTLSHDYTHNAMETLIPEYHEKLLFGKNGHLFCRLICGRIGNTLVINVPGPFVEASAAIQAFCESLEGEDLESINLAMAEAVKSQYPCQDCRDGDR